MQPRKVTGEELEVALADRSKPLIIDFYADWCGPCVLLAKELEQVCTLRHASELHFRNRRPLSRARSRAPFYRSLKI